MAATGGADDERGDTTFLLPGEDPEYASSDDQAQAVMASQGTIPWLAGALAVSLGLSILLIRRLNSLSTPDAEPVPTRHSEQAKHLAR